MECHLKSVIYRLNKINLQLNKSPKYSAFFVNDEFFNKIGNKLDEILKISYYLLDLLNERLENGVETTVMEPTDIEPIDSESSDIEVLQDVDEMNDTSNDPIRKMFRFDDKKFSFFDLDKLPVDVESEFDYNFLNFTAYLSYLKPAFYFVHEHELVPNDRQESEKENLARVLINIVQLLIFARTVSADMEANIKVVIYSLFFNFDALFGLKGQNLTTLSFLREYPREAVFFLIFCDFNSNSSKKTHEELIQELRIIFENYSALDISAKFQLHLEEFRSKIDETIQLAELPEKLLRTLRTMFNFDEFKSMILKIALDSASKIKSSIEDLELKDKYTLNESVLSRNLAEELDRQKEKMIRERRLELEEQSLEFNKQLEQIKRENELLKAEVSYKETKIANLKNELKNVSDISEEKKLTSSNIKEYYPDLFDNLKTEFFQLANHRDFATINRLEAEAAEARSALNHYKNSR